jgi:excisionase family DNA binding protein
MRVEAQRGMSSKRRRYRTPGRPARQPGQGPEEDRMLTTEQAADQLGASVWTVRRWLNEGRIKGVMPGGRRLGWRIPQAEITRLLRPRRAGDTAEEEGG